MAPPSDWVMGGGRGRSDSRLGLRPRGRWRRPAWGFGAPGPSRVCVGRHPQLRSELLCDLGPVPRPLWSCFSGEEGGHQRRRDWHRHPLPKRRSLGVMSLCPLLKLGPPTAAWQWKGWCGGGGCRWMSRFHPGASREVLWQGREPVASWP